jgi:protein involved in polysaccharide export with SLBB domain
LREAGVLQRPVVRLTLQTRIGRYFNIRGSVVAPGRQPIPQPDLRLLDAIALAGDIGPEVRELYILRRQDQRAWRDADELIAPEDELPADENGLVIPPPMEENWSMGAAPGLIATASFLQEEEEAAETADDEAALEEVMSPGADADADDGDRPFDPIIFDPVTGEPIEAPPAEEEEPTEPEDAAAVEELPVDDGETDEPFDWEDVPAYEDMHRVIRIDVRALKAGDPRYNVVIRNGDTINVPVDTGVFYMMGEVNQPGVYAFNGREITIKQAVGALARGFSALAWPSKCEIIRREPGTDRELIIPVNLDRIYAGLEPDILLQDEDIVNVGTDPISPFLFVIRNSFRFTYGFGFVYDRNFADIDSFSAQANPNDVRRQQRAQRGLPF